MKDDYSAKFVWDARHTGQRALRFTTGRRYDDYLDNELLRSAVERQLSIIGEAFAQVRRIDPAVADAIPNMPQIFAFRDILIHDYTGIDDTLVWKAIQIDLPKLVESLDRLLAEYGPA